MLKLFWAAASFRTSLSDSCSAFSRAWFSAVTFSITPITEASAASVLSAVAKVLNFNVMFPQASSKSLLT